MKIKTVFPNGSFWCLLTLNIHWLGSPMAVHANEAAPPLTEVRVRIGNASDPTEPQQMKQLLNSLLGQPATLEVAKKAEAILKKTNRYRSVVCRFGKNAQQNRMTCGLTRSRTIRFIRIEGLPPSFLETDFRKRIFLKEGELIDQQEVSGKNRITRQRKRLEKYLYGEGFASAKVQVLTPPVPGSHAVDILVRITGGHFIQVRKAYNKGDDPPIPLTIIFKNMCASMDQILETVGPQTVSCFTPQLFKDVLKNTEDQLREIGYKSARLRADVIPVTKVMLRENDDICRPQKEDLPNVPRCVDIKLKLRLGIQEATKIKINTAAPPEKPWVQKTLDFLKVEKIHHDLKQLFQPALSHGAPLSAGQLTEDIYAERDIQRTTLPNKEMQLIAENEVQKSFYALADVKVRTRTKNKRAVQKIKIRPGKAFRIKSIKIKGNQHFNDQELLQEVLIGTQPYHLFAPGAFVQDYLQADISRLKGHYADAGFSKTSVQTRITSDPHQNIEIVFEIDEGPMQTISGVFLHHGILSLQEFFIANFDLCPNHPLPANLTQKPLGPFCAQAAFLPDAAETQRQKLISLFAQQGYPYADVTLTQTEKEDGFELHYYLDPDVTFKAQASLEAFKQNLPPVLLGEVLFDGNIQTQTNVLRREMGISESYRNLPLDPLFLAEGIARLRKTGLFSRVQLKYLGIEEQWRRVHPQIFIEEKSYFTVDTSLSFSTDTFFSSQTKLKHRNLFGAMLDYEGVIDNGLFWGRVSLLRSSLKWPHILGTPLNFSVIAPELYYEDRPQPIAVDSQITPPRQRTAQTRITAGLNWILANNDILAMDYEMRWEWWEPAGPPISLLHDAGEAISTIDGLLVATELTPIQKGLIRPSYRSMKLDNPFNPKNGHQVEVGFGISHPLLGGATNYTILLANLSQVKSFGPLTTAWRLSSKMSAIDNPEEQWFLLRNEIPTLGGDRTIRGYGDRSVGVLGPLKDQRGEVLIDEETQETQQGIHTGNMSHLLNLELRFPLLPGAQGDNLQGAFFSDLGIVTIAENPLNVGEVLTTLQNTDDPNRLGFSVGAGLRYILPVGPVAADIALSPIHQQLNGSPLWRFHLQFGFPF